MTNHLVGIAEVAGLLGVSRQRVDQLARRYPDFPPPEADLAAGRVWSAAAIEAWAALHPHRAPGRQAGPSISLDRLTVESRATLVRAREEARALRHNYVGCEHVVLALARRESVAGRALRALGLASEGAEAALGRLMAPGNAGPDAPRPLADSLRKALAHAEDVALETAHRQVAPEHLLLGILRQDENAGTRLIEEAGLDTGELRLRTLGLMGLPQTGEDGTADAPGRELERVLSGVMLHLASIDARLARLERSTESGRA